MPLPGAVSGTGTGPVPAGARTPALSGVQPPPADVSHPPRTIRSVYPKPAPTRARVAPAPGWISTGLLGRAILGQGGVHRASIPPPPARASSIKFQQDPHHLEVFGTTNCRDICICLVALGTWSREPQINLTDLVFSDGVINGLLSGGEGCQVDPVPRVVGEGRALS